MEIKCSCQVSYEKRHGKSQDQVSQKNDIYITQGGILYEAKNSNKGTALVALGGVQSCRDNSGIYASEDISIDECSITARS